VFDLLNKHHELMTLLSQVLARIANEDVNTLNLHHPGNVTNCRATICHFPVFLYLPMMSPEGIRKVYSWDALH